MRRPVGAPSASCAAVKKTGAARKKKSAEASREKISREKFFWEGLP